MERIFALVGFLEIMLVLFIQWEVYIKKIINTFSIGSYVISVFLFYLGFSNGDLFVIVLAILTALTRGFFIPWYMKRRLTRDPWREREIKPVISTALSIIISVFVVVFSYVIYRITFYNSIHLSAGSIPIALLFQGAFLMISRRNAFVQLIGYMTMENAIFLFEGYLFPTLPFIVEAGIVLDLIGIVAIAGIIVRMMRDAATDAKDFEELKG